MRIGSVLENHEIEKRISITPDIVKKYSSLGFEIFLSENYGRHIGINDDEYLTTAFVAVTDFTNTTYFGYPNNYATYGLTLNYQF